MRNDCNHEARSKGFTLIELVVVIVILGILAATALPRFINLSNQARISAVQAVAGGLRSGVALSIAAYAAAGNGAATTVSMSGVNVTVAAATGVPTNDLAGIGTVMQCPAATGDCNGVNVNLTGGPNTFQPPNGGGATCRATYAATGVVALDVSGC